MLLALSLRKRADHPTSSDAWAAARDRRARSGVPRCQRAARLPGARRRSLVGAVRAAQAGPGAAPAADPRSGGDADALRLLPDLHSAATRGMAREPQACLPALPGGWIEPSAQASSPQRQRCQARTAACRRGTERYVVDGLRFGRPVRRSPATSADGGRRRARYIWLRFLGATRLCGRSERCERRRSSRLGQGALLSCPAVA